MEKLSHSQEDYLEEIYVQVLNNGFAKVTAIAKSLNVKKASVTAALIQLTNKGLINYSPYSSITLTLDGEKQAKRILKKHKILNELFSEVLNLNDASQIACEVEHLISDKNVEKITKFISNYKAIMKN